MSERKWSLEEVVESLRQWKSEFYSESETTWLMNKAADLIESLNQTMEFVVMDTNQTILDKIVVNSIEELKAIVDELHPGWHNDGENKDIIINFDKKEIVIYDDYVE